MNVSEGLHHANVYNRRNTTILDNCRHQKLNEIFIMLITLWINKIILSLDPVYDYDNYFRQCLKSLLEQPEIE